MPFKSKKQEQWMRINKPSMYRRWVKKYGHFRRKKRRRRRRR